MRTFVKGESDYIGIEISRKDAGEFGVTQASCEVRFANEVLEAGPCVVETEGQKHKLLYLLDSRQEHFVAGRVYQAYISASIAGGPVVRIGVVTVHVSR